MKDDPQNRSMQRKVAYQQRGLFANQIAQNRSQTSHGSLPRPISLDQLKIQYAYITSPRKADEAVSLLEDIEGPLGVDIETAKISQYATHNRAGLDPHLSSIRLFQAYAGGKTAYIFDIHHLGLKPLTPLWNHPMVAHNAVFDLKHLIHNNAVPTKMGCTLLMANALTGKRMSLADAADRFLGWYLNKEYQTAEWGAAHLSDSQLSYAVLDAVAVYQLYHTLQPRLKKQHLGHVYGLMRNAQPAIARMELAGINFDFNGHALLVQEWQKNQVRLAEDLAALLGTGLNPDSSRQVSDWLANTLDNATLAKWPVTPTGLLKTDLKTLSRNKDNPLVHPLKNYKSMANMLTAFGSVYDRYCSPCTGRVHANFNLAGTATGRISCHAPNIQNPPRDARFRKLFNAPPRTKLIVADYGQIELRVAAMMSGDKNMLKAYAAGADLHRKTASYMAGIAAADVTPAHRQAAKAVNFGLLYGQGARGLASYARSAYGISMSLAEAEKARDAFFQVYPDLAQWQRAIVEQARKQRWVSTPAGRRRNLISSGSHFQYTEALNTPVQGGAAEILLAALAFLVDTIVSEPAHLVNIVHDEIVLEVADDKVDQVKSQLEEAMTKGVLAIFPDASTIDLVEARVGDNWAEAK